MMSSNYKSIKDVVKKNGCAFCGTCEAICPSGAISHKKTDNSYKFIIDKNKCTNCGLCLKVCSGIGIDYDYHNQKIFGKKLQSEEDKLLGVVENCYYTYSKDKNIRYHSASGGSISSFLIFLLERK